MPLSKAAFGLGEDPEPEEDTTEVEEEEEESSTEDEDPILDGESGDDEDLFSDEEDDEDEDGKSRRKPAVERRIDKLVAERQEARESVLELTGKVGAYEEQIEGLRELNSTFDQLYGRFDDPEEQLRFDAALIGELERESSSNQELARLLQPLIKKVGDNPVAEERETPKTDTPAGPDPLLVKLAQRDASGVIKAALPEGVRPSFSTLLEKEIFSALDPADLADLDSDTVLAAAKDFAKKNGFTRDDIYAASRAAGDDTPDTGGRSKPATRRRGAKEVADKKAEEAPKTPHEWRERNIRRLEAAIGSDE